MRPSRALSLLVAVTVMAVLASVTPALAETHPFRFSFGSFTNPNGIAVEESTGDVYVADLATNTVSKFDSSGALIESWGSKGVLDGSSTATGPFSFPNEPGNPASIAVDNSISPSDPSAGDLYVLDAGHGVIDKFNPSGEYLNQITGPFSGVPLGLGVDANGNVRVELGVGIGVPATAVFDNSAANSFVELRRYTGPPGGGDAELAINVVPEYGFVAGSPPGEDYALVSLPCGCLVKLGDPNYKELGRVDSDGTAVAAAVDPANGHLYVDEQSSVSELDTGEMTGVAAPGESPKGSGTPVSSFGSLQLSGASGQSGIAVNGASGDVYVSNPSDGKVYVFGNSAPLVVAGTPANVTQSSATLQGTVDPRVMPVISCEFEYQAGNIADLRLPIAHPAQSVPCVTDDGEPIGAGTSPVAVHADVSGLQPGSLYHFRLVAGNANGTSLSGGLFPTVSAGFGIKSFEVAFLNKDGTPDVQAGSHPYQMLTNIAFNTQIVQRPAIGELRYAPLPMGSVKDVIVNLPPGLYGDPNATTKKCTLNELEPPADIKISLCPVESQIGVLQPEWLKGDQIRPEQALGTSGVWSMVPPPGVAFQLGTHLIKPNAFINVGVPAGGNSGVRAIAPNAPITGPVLGTRLTIFGGAPAGSKKPLLTLPSACNGPLTSTISVDSYQDPGHFVGASSVTRNSAGAPAGMTGCAQLEFPPEIKVAPDVSAASSSSGLTADVHVSQKAAFNPDGLSESSLRDTTVTLPAGVALNPSGAGGLEACPEGLAGFTGFAEFNPGFEPGDLTPTFTEELPSPLQPGTNFCPDGSKIGTVKLTTPLLPDPLEGAVYLAAQNANPFGSLVAMYMVIEDPVSGTIVKLTGRVSLCEGAGETLEGVTCEAPGQIVTTFKNTPQLPFEDLQLHFFGGERAPLTTPAHCGTYTTQASFTPWDGNGPVNTTSSFQIVSGPHGSPCPGTALPFNPSLTAGSSNIQAGAFTPFTTTMSREDGEQNLQALSLKMPPGLSGLLSGVTLCGEAEANAGTCGPGSLIGETTVSVGVGSQPFSVTGGKVYITGPYRGAPFGLSIVNPAKAGPFDLGKVIVRAKIEVDPLTAALTVTSDNDGNFKIPQYIKGIPLQIKHVNVTITRPGFTFNPTNCNPMQIGGTLNAVEGASQTLAVPFQATNCASLGFAPKFAVSTPAKSSKANGAGLSVKLTYPKAPFGSQANIAKVKVELPKQLPSRLTTLQKACTAAQFNSNPAGCPAASVIGHAKAITPLLPVPLEGPAYFVSHGGEAFPSLIIVLQGYGVTIELVGTTFISKAGITSTTFKTVPDAPVGSFELTLPQGKFSALASNLPAKANGSFCGQKLVMPSEFIAQNGAVIHQSTRINATGCAKAKTLTRAQKLARAMKACKQKPKGRRAGCVRQARQRYGAVKRKKK
jgi:hypothetical protein